ncbi:MAG TPA: hypothetical protein VHF67_08500 [Gaiellaceae bacterium]|nr:hypothetical protein [Gaiellaceae bacterium]
MCPPVVPVGGGRDRAVERLGHPRIGDLQDDVVAPEESTERVVELRNPRAGYIVGAAMRGV